MRTLRRFRLRRGLPATWWAGLGLACLLALVWSARAAPHRAAGGLTALPSPDHFEFSAEANEQLRALWQASAEARQERVACLGGSAAGGAWRLTGIGPLAPAAGDSLGVSASASIRRCGPPRWLGTVHTHVALRDGVRPYPTFSGSDRGVMMLWWRQWGRHGIFCVLYSTHDAHCEADGLLLAGPGTHVTY